VRLGPTSRQRRDRVLPSSAELFLPASRTYSSSRPLRRRRTMAHAPPAIIAPHIKTIIKTIAMISIVDISMPNCIYPGLRAITRSTMPHFDR
jgi:hypothetical protein